MAAKKGKGGDTYMMRATSLTKCPRMCPMAQVGLNAHRVVHKNEWWRCATSLCVHSNLSHLLSNAGGLAEDGLPLEARLGGARLAGLALSCAAMEPALYGPYSCVRWLLPCQAPLPSGAGSCHALK